jgi:hypothetical protein
VNWLGAGLPSFLAAVFGTIIGALLHFEGQRRGIDFPPIVAIVAGALAALASREKSGLRGVLVASFAVWAAAVAEILGTPIHGFFRDILDFHERLNATRFALYLATAVVGFLLAPRAWAPFGGSKPEQLSA